MRNKLPIKKRKEEVRISRVRKLLNSKEYPREILISEMNSALTSCDLQTIELLMDYVELPKINKPVEHWVPGLKMLQWQSDPLGSDIYNNSTMLQEEEADAIYSKLKALERKQKIRGMSNADGI